MRQVVQKDQVPFKTPFFYGWVIVFISGLAYFFSGPGQTYSVSVFLDSYIAEFGWSRSFVSSLYSSGTLLAGFMLYLVGRQVDRRGHRKVMPVIAISFALACVWMSLVFNPVMLFIGFFAIRLLGQGSMTLTGTTLAPQWFEKKRGRAMSFVSLGGVIGAAALPPINTWLIYNYGWKTGWLFWAILLVVVMAPLAYLLVRNRPEDVGLLVDNQSTSEDGLAKPSDTIAENSWTLDQARRTRTFWLVLFCTFVPSMVNTGLVFHMVSILGVQGISPQVSAIVLSLMALVAMPFTFISGFILDRFPANKVMTLTFVGQVAIMILLLFARTVEFAIAFGVLRGIVQGFEGMNTNVIWPNYFGRKHLASIRGFATTFIVIGSAFGPMPFGLAYDFFGGYTEIILLMMIFPIIGIVASLLATKPEQQ